MKTWVVGFVLGVALFGGVSQSRAQEQELLDPTHWEGRYLGVETNARTCPAELMLTATPSELTVRSTATESGYPWVSRLGHRTSSESLGDPLLPWHKEVRATLNGDTWLERTVWERCGSFFGLADCWRREVRILRRQLVRTTEGLQLTEQLSTGDLNTSDRQVCSYRAVWRD